MKMTVSMILVLALLAVPSMNALSIGSFEAGHGAGATLVHSTSDVMIEATMLDLAVGGTAMTWCVAMVGAAIGALAFSGGLSLGFAFVWGATCWSGG